MTAKSRQVYEVPLVCPSCGAAKDRIERTYTEREGQSIIEGWACADCNCEWDNEYEYVQTTIRLEGEKKGGAL